jgi:hypothetical protein
MSRIAPASPFSRKPGDRLDVTLRISYRWALVNGRTDLDPKLETTENRDTQTHCSEQVFGWGLSYLSPKQSTIKVEASRLGEIRIAVGTHITMRPPHKTVRAAFPHTASTSGI